MPNFEVTRDQVAAFRLTRHHLIDPKPRNLITICRDVGGFQSQVNSAAYTAIWARDHSIRSEKIRNALDPDRTLVKINCLRQTLHLIPSEDFSIYIRALEKSQLQASRRIMVRFGITGKETEWLNRTILDALHSGPRSKKELTDEIATLAPKNIRNWMKYVWSIFRPAMAVGLICYASDRGNEVAFVRTDQWLPEFRRVEEWEAQQILLRRYLAGFGPATQRDFSRWSGIPVTPCKKIWESLQDEIAEITVEGRVGYLLKRDREAFRKILGKKPILRLLPAFDPFLLGHVEKDHVINSRDYKRVYRNQGWISPVILLDGRITGIWSSSRLGKQLWFDIVSFTRLSGTIKKKIEEEVTSLGKFLKSTWEIRFNKP